MAHDLCSKSQMATGPFAFRRRVAEASASSSSAQEALRRLSAVKDDLAERVGNGSVAGQAGQR